MNWLTFAGKRVLVEGPSLRRKLQLGKTYRQGLVRKSVPGYTQAYQWLEGMDDLHRELKYQLSGLLGGPQIGQEGRLQPCSRDPSPSTVPSPTHCSAVRGNCDREPGMASP